MRLIHSLLYSPRTDIRILRHSLFWITDLINYMIVVVGTNGTLTTSFYIFLFKFPLIILTTYFILYSLLPLSNTPNSRNKLILGVVFVLLVLGVVTRYYKFYLVAPILDPHYQHITEVWDFAGIIQEIFSSMAVVCMAVMIKVLKTKSQLQQRNTQLENEKKQSELNFLKAQMQPHFLFNTLNTLYSETIQESGKAQTLVLNLSNLLRFVLEESGKPLISVSKEIMVIKDFIALEQLRHGDRLKVDLAADNISSDVFISPLIFLPFVENSFKHTLKNINGPIHIDIHINHKSDQLCLTVENDVSDQVIHDSLDQQKNGIANTKRQLDLLYGNEYLLDIVSSGNKYRINLSIPAKKK